MASFSFTKALLILNLLNLSATLAEKILLGSELSASSNQSWISDNGTFAFGFAPFSSEDNFLLAIWYAGLPGDQTIVWSPNRYKVLKVQFLITLSTVFYFIITIFMTSETKI